VGNTCVGASVSLALLTLWTGGQPSPYIAVCVGNRSSTPTRPCGLQRYTSGVKLLRLLLLILFSVVSGLWAHAETGEDAWLRYAPLSNETVRRLYTSLPTRVVNLSRDAISQSATREVVGGLGRMLGLKIQDAGSPEGSSAILLGTLSGIRRTFPGLIADGKPAAGTFWLKTARWRGQKYWIVAGADPRGVLYGTFSLLGRIASGESVTALDDLQSPYAPLRWVNQWDNLDGSIERGYAGRSIFFDSGAVRTDLTRVSEYARLLASVGINGCVINNVNASPRILADDFLPQLARIAEAFRPWGVQLAISVDFSSPKTTGGLSSFDPADPQVAAWWKKKADEIYARIPDFGGLLVKADSEGRSGPSTYGRTHADAANVLARALKAHGGVVFYRGFVYNHHLDWRDPKADRAKAAYDNFHPLDGKFDDNVIVQTKYGPIDFQAREPVSPLFGGLQKTNEAIELQITQEYTGQQRHLCFLAPMWKQVLDFDLRVNDRATPVKDLISGRTFHRPAGGFAGVANVGLDANWLAHPLAMANLYGFGRLAWNPDLAAEKVAEEWTQLTFGNDPLVVRTIAAMQLASWRIYESYTGPLGAGTLTDILGPHYGPGIESSERNGWGQWHRADHDGIGMDRTMATGTGFIGQYWPVVRQLYETLEKCPDELLLFMHHVPYTHILHSGKTVIQHIYDSHYDGAEQALQLVEQWQTLHGHVDDERYEAVLQRLQYQAGHAEVWRDAICEWFLRTSGIADEQGRAGHHPGRIEAEAMQLDGYEIVAVNPWETASGGKAVACHRPAGCATSFAFSLSAGSYDLSVQYFDQSNGVSRYRVSVNDHLADEWLADDHLPSAQMNGHTSTRHTARMELHAGDVVRVEGTPDEGEPAPLDYVEIRRAH